MTTSHDPPASHEESSGRHAQSKGVGVRRRVSPVAWLGVTLLIAVVCIAVVLQVFVARRIPELTPTALDAAESRWNERGPTSYDMDFTIEGAQPGEVHVEVRGGQVVAMSRDGTTPKQPRTWIYWSVPGRFEEIARELELAEDPEHEMNAAAGTRVRLRCEFDPDLGYPREFHRMIFGGGSEVYWRVTNFESK